MLAQAARLVTDSKGSWLGLFLGGDIGEHLGVVGSNHNRF